MNIGDNVKIIKGDSATIGQIGTVKDITNDGRVLVTGEGFNGAVIASLVNGERKVELSKDSRFYYNDMIEVV